MGKGTDPNDEFEAKHMASEGRVLHHDKRVSRVLAGMLAVPGLLTILLGVFIALTNATASRPVPGAALPFVVAGVAGLGALLMLMGVVFGVLRTIVTDKEVNIKYGLWGPTISLGDVVSCRAVDYEWTEFGGWGIRMGKNGAWAYVPSGSRAVEIRYREGSKEKRVLVGVASPEEVARKINEAAARFATRPGDRLRVPIDDRVDPETRREIEAEVEAALEADGSKSTRRRKS